MSVDWTLYSTYLNNGEYEISTRDRIVMEAAELFSKSIVDDPSYQPYTTVNGSACPMAVSRKTTINASIKLPTQSKTFIGDIVNTVGENWIVVELFPDDIGIDTGEIWLCNGELKFQEHSGDIYTTPCVINNGSYTRVSLGADASTPNNTYELYAQLNEHTEQLYIDKRIALGYSYSPFGERILEVYKIIGLDNKTKNSGFGNHMTIITLQRDVYNPDTDDIETMLCDVTHNETIEAEVPSDAQIIISGKDTIRIGSTKTYALQNKMSAEGAVWTMSAPNGITYSQDGDSCTISVPFNETLIGSEIVLSVLGAEKKVKVVAIG